MGAAWCCSSCVVLFKLRGAVQAAWCCSSCVVLFKLRGAVRAAWRDTAVDAALITSVRAAVPMRHRPGALESGRPARV
jgi:hypothetical protein